jgi:hypothetical protein
MFQPPTSSGSTLPFRRLVLAGQWTTLTFFLPGEPVRSFFQGNGVLDTSTGKGVLEHLEFVPAAGPGACNA